MWNLIRKNFKLVIYSKSFLILPFYALYLALMKIPSLGWSSAANVIVTFVLIGSFSSMIAGVGKKNNADDIYYSLPIPRKSHLYADYLMTLIYTIFAIAYIFIWDLIFSWIVPDNLLDAGSVTAGECIYIFLIIVMILFFESLMPGLSDLEHSRKGFFILYLMTVIALSLWIYPMLIILIKQGHLGLGDLSGPFALLTRGIEILNQPIALGMTLVLVALLSIVSLRLSLTQFSKKEI
jgi:hypothetical protein